MNNICGTVKTTGRMRFRKYIPNNGLLIPEAGIITDDEWIDNLVVDVGLAHLAGLAAGLGEAPMGYMALGTGNTPPVKGDTALVNEIDRNALESKTRGTGADANKVTFVCQWAPGDGTGAITESAIFNSPSAGAMLCRTAFGTKTKEPLEALEQIWVLTFSS